MSHIYHYFRPLGANAWRLLPMYIKATCTNVKLHNRLVIESRMEVPNTRTTAFLAIVLFLSLARSTADNSCQTVIVPVPIEERKDSSNVICTGVKLQAKCAGFCSSHATVEMTGGAPHWYQHCECCQPINGYSTISFTVPLNCTDNSTQFVLTHLVYPNQCQCTDC